MLNLKIKNLEQDRFISDIEGWLSGDEKVNLAPDMYTNDTDDTRWRKGHSAETYYVEKDELATFAQVMSELNIHADNLFDLGVGGKEAVLAKGLPLAEKIGAANYYACDLSESLADEAVDLVEVQGIRGHSVICDFFENLPFSRSKSLIALLGLTLGNIESLESREQVKARLAEIFKIYMRTVRADGHLLISFDANKNADEIKSCYANPEFGGLVRGLVDKAIDTSAFDYDVVWNASNVQLATGLRSKHDQIVRFNGNSYAIEKAQFLPVLNSYRFPVELVEAAARQAGWLLTCKWSATGRVHYLLFSAG